MLVEGRTKKEDQVVEKKQSLPELIVKSRNKEEEMSREWDGNEAERPRRVSLPSNASTIRTSKRIETQFELEFDSKSKSKFWTKT